MTRIEEEKLDTIHGGNTTISGPIISALTTIIKILKEAGYAVGSGVRRIAEDNLCPLN